MANGVPDQRLERAKFFRDHIQTILSLATGSIVLSVTFLHDLVPKPTHGEYLRRSWWIFLATIFLGLAYNYVLSIYVDVEGKKYGNFLSILSFCFHVSFVVAIYYLLRFGTMNL